MTRLYLTQTLHEGQIIELTKDQQHYLEKVLRFSSGQQFLGFNEKDGEWQITYEKPLYRCIKQTRTPALIKPCWLAFAPIKNDPMTFLIEKATELGVTDLQPILTERTNSHRINIERLIKNTLEAAQQCERLDIPKVHQPVSLISFLHNIPKEIHWYAALERYNGLPLNLQLPAGFIIGPEGGWSAKERVVLEKYATPISLGKNILRAETASIICLGAIIFQKNL